MHLQSLCDGCIKPASRRLALLGIKDEFDCYSENYVKCFWNLCDQHRSNDDIAFKPVTPNTKLITVEPKHQEMPYKNYDVLHDGVAVTRN